MKRTSVKSSLLNSACMVALVSMVVASMTGCSSAQHVSAPSDGVTARCPVCEQRADLACLNVKVTDQTPRSDWQGKRYYFCSEECKVAFDKNPAKYR